MLVAKGSAGGAPRGEIWEIQRSFEIQGHKQSHKKETSSTKSFGE